MDADGLYELTYYTRHDGVPCTFRSGTLVAALATAWRNQHAGGRSHAIAQTGTTVLSRADLAHALEQISELSAAAPMRSIIELAEAVLRVG
jgi:hypothetical protein